ncbi:MULTISPECIES: hypothetical protein [Pseudomonas]|uniref:hypothetical protein n=1 Tax=Pseudomonadaceae TaxID=135621 RepID=UPI0006842100|nr:MULTISPECIES: hypothetical protein [Pseudomonas]MDE3735696.1 hypothetical protein [Pseudomonas resinovorans]
MAINSISGLGAGSALSGLGFRNGKSAKESEDPFAINTKEEPRRTTSPGSERDYRAWQATEEGFARMRVELQNSAGKLEMSNKDLPADLELGGQTAVEKFQEYMDKSPAEKMRDAILAEMGLTQEELDAMPPEQREAVEKEIAERFQQRMEMQAKEEEEEKLQRENPTIRTQA